MPGLELTSVQILRRHADPDKVVHMYTHILAGLDGSPQAPWVLRHAADLAARTGAVLHLCRAVSVPVGVPFDAWMLTGNELTARLLSYGAEELQALAHDFHPSFTPIAWGQHYCRFGSPGQVIVDLAVEIQANLIVVGSHGYGILDRIIGTTAARIVNNAHCSVLVVRARAPVPS